MFFVDTPIPRISFEGRESQDLVFSATDLVAATSCEFAIVQALDEKLGRSAPSPALENSMLERAIALGENHEAAVLAGYREQFGEFTPGHIGGVYEVDTRHGYSFEELTAKNAETIATLKGGADVVFQGSFFDGEFFGRADFLVKQEDDSYAVYDTKLARTAKATALLQLAAYADQLHKNGISVAPHAGLILGTGERALFDIDSVLYVVADRRRRLRQLVAAHGASGTSPVHWWEGSQAVSTLSQCGRCERCLAEAQRHRDVLLTAGLTVRQRTALVQNFGVRTIDELAVLEAPAGRQLSSTVAKLKVQAALQTGVLEPDGAVTYREGDELKSMGYTLMNRSVLDGLPLANAGDLFIETLGDSLWQGSEGSWGLEYLLGALETNPNNPMQGRFTSFWAHTRAQERTALVNFVEYLAQRRAQFPGMRIYHYTSAPKQALRNLAASHGVGEDIIDQLLRENVLVDLFDTVRESLHITEGSYGLEKLEPLYKGENFQVREAKDAGALAITYAEFCQAREVGEEESAQQFLTSLSEGAHRHCASLVELRQWLLGLAERDVSREYEREPEVLAAVELLEANQVDAEETASAAELTLHNYLDQLGPDADLSADEQAVAMVASATGYHRRERKQFWWDHFDRLAAPVEDWAETRNTLIFDRIAVRENWHVPPRKRSMVRIIEARARMAEGSSLKVGERNLYLMYGAPLPSYFEEMLMAQATHFAATNGTGALPRVMDRAGHFTGEILDFEKQGISAGFVTVRVVLQETLPQVAQPFHELPIALTPAAPLHTAAQEGSLVELALRVGSALPTLPRHAGVDILRKRPPKLTTGFSLPRPEEFVEAQGSMATAEAIYRSVKELDNSYVAVQGPPGSGKTFVGSHVISRLVRDGWRVGVVAQSHAVVDNMLAGCISNGKIPPARIAKAQKRGKDPNPHGWWELSTFDIGKFMQQPGVLFGGTAWDFANRSKFSEAELDLLVIDEAGQYSLANTLAVSRAARNLLLLGDPQQLPQVTQGSHPYPVDESALGWLSAGHTTLPDTLGYFLDVTWRMHPQLTSPVSQLSYSDKLRSAPAGEQRSLQGRLPGVYALAVPHTGNTTASSEEAQEIVKLALSFLGLEWVGDTTNPQPRPLEPADILVVAAYNAQVDLITEHLIHAGLQDVRVGTVDKFQGQEAPVVLVSMAASNAGDSARGAEFLLSPNRLNVAISRGKWCAVIVHAPTLTQYLPATPDALLLLGRFTRLLARARKLKQLG
ncbi:AAA domain-containing protein [Rothia sp. ZJ1223]|uniref:AAA domain-containing protein n=1 Tax=Rothia sp. ZJ1223 TaxID=2811098 RepID=UPI00195B611A|nr:AAA domain-containing protein [Rothia sp. ZJ1223]MBM7051622.1 AAA family ATPase [Rothia sp. ZJ1223]